MNKFIEFLTLLFNEGLSYSSLNTARSAISSFTWVQNKSIGSHYLVSKFMKGVFNLRPALPKATVTWDTGIVLNFLKTWHPAKNLSLLQLSMKVVILMLLITGQRCQTVWEMDLKNITIERDCVTCSFGNPLKTSTVKHHQSELVLKAYPEDKSLCVVYYLKEYIKRTKILRKKGGGSKLFIMTREPYTPVSRDTIARWTKTGLMKSGINMKIFTPHSTRAASTSKAKQSVQLSTILKTAGWRRASTFATFYDKKISDEGWSVKNLQ